MEHADSMVDVPRLTEWLNEQGIGAGPLTDIAPLTGGTQNVMLRLRRDGQDLVLRRPPLHKRPGSDETMRREAAILAGLASSQVPHSKLVATCDDHDVLGCTFFVTELVTGFTATEEVPEPHASDEDLQHAMGLSLVDALAALGRVNPEEAGVAHLGRPAGWLERQVQRWRKQLDSYAEFDGWTGADLPALDRLTQWLEANRPASWQAGLIHGDFHFGNVMFRRDSGQVAAVVDWELCTVGDPLLDLGHMLATWPDPAESRTVGTAQALPGLPSRDEVIDRYANGSGRDLRPVDWYQALACYRLGILLEGTHARACAGKAPADVGERLHRTAVYLFEQGIRLATETRF